MTADLSHPSGPPAAPRVYLWCPAYPLADATALLATQAAAMRFSEALGIGMTCSPQLGRHPGPGAWLPAAERAVDLRMGAGYRWLLAARGGYGCTELLENLDRPLPQVIGYSDLTVLHAAQAVLGGPGGLYGFMPGVRHGERALTSAIALARGEGCKVSSLPESSVLRPGTASGPLFAGCLRVLAGLAGTRWMPNLVGRILALEDIDERPYRVERDLFQLHTSGALRGITGLVFGRFPSGTVPGYAGPSIEQVCARWADHLDVPAIFGLPIGHDSDPLTLAIDRWTTLTARQDGWELAQDPTTGTSPT